MRLREIGTGTGSAILVAISCSSIALMIAAKAHKDEIIDLLAIMAVQGNADLY